MSQNDKYLLCYPDSKNPDVFRPLTYKDGSLYLMPLGVAQGKVADGGCATADMIILNAEDFLKIAPR